MHFFFFSLLFFIRNPSQLLVLLHTLHQGFFFDRNMMAKYVAVRPIPLSSAKQAYVGVSSPLGLSCGE